ncbi:MAG: FAD:protein FMN transferase [Treponema sp.]|nr:FAD:protein FMN transferase [Treponema sp.]
MKLNVVNVALGIAVLFSFTVAISCSKKAMPTRTQPVLGTVCSINAYDDASDALYDELFARLKEIDERFSATRRDSDISQVNAQAGIKAVPVHRDVYFVVQTALNFAQKTDGAFDPTVGPLVKLWGINTENARVPSQEEIDEALPLVNWRKVQMDPGDGETSKRIFLLQKGMALDLGGIAKGYAADEMARILGEHNVRQAIVNLGGNVYAYGSKKDGSKWKVAVKNPQHPASDPALAICFNQNNSVVTSGAYERYFEKNGRRYHHIINPKIGYPEENNVGSVTIVSRSSIEADALSTAAYILGPNEYFKRERTAALFILEDSSVKASLQLAGKIEVLNPSFSNIVFR